MPSAARASPTASPAARLASAACRNRCAARSGCPVRSCDAASSSRIPTRSALAAPGPATMSSARR